MAEYDGKIKSEDGILPFLKSLKFDQNNRYLVGYGDLSVFILNLNNGEGNVH